MILTFCLVDKLPDAIEKKNAVSNKKKKRFTKKKKLILGNTCIPIQSRSTIRINTLILLIKHFIKY